jgi:hypothetical protein
MQENGLKKAFSTRTLARLMDMGRDHLTKADTVTVAAIEARVPDLVDARSLVERLLTTIRTNAVPELDGWIEQAKVSLIPRSLGASPKTSRLSPKPGRPVKQKARSRSSSWSNGRCTAVPSSTCSKPGIGAA